MGQLVVVVDVLNIVDVVAVEQVGVGGQVVGCGQIGHVGQGGHVVGWRQVGQIEQGGHVEHIGQGGHVVVGVGGQVCLGGQVGAGGQVDGELVVVEGHVGVGGHSVGVGQPGDVDCGGDWHNLQVLVHFLMHHVL